MCSYKRALVLLELGENDKARGVLEDLASKTYNSTYAANATGLVVSLPR